MTHIDDIPIPQLTDGPGICADCKHLAPRLRQYGKVIICHACTTRRRKAAREEQPDTQRRLITELEQHIRVDRCTDCGYREPDGRHWADANLCLTCENEMLERIGLEPYTIEHDVIRV